LLSLFSPSFANNKFLLGREETAIGCISTKQTVLVVLTDNQNWSWRWASSFLCFLVFFVLPPLASPTTKEEADITSHRWPYFYSSFSFSPQLNWH
jgi:hypothetical protein